MPSLLLFAVALFLGLGAVLLLTTQYYFLALAPVIIIPVLFLLFKRPILAYYSIIFFVPFSTLRQLSGAYDFLTISKLAGAILVVIVAFHFFFHRGEALKMSSNLWKWLVIFMMVCLVSAVASDFSPLPFEDLRGLITAYLVFAMSLFFISRDRLAHGLPRVIIASVTLNALLSLVGYALNIETLTMDVTAKSLKRAVGASGNPNHFACMVIFAIPLIIHGFATARNQARRLFFAAALGICVLAVIFTFSRSGALVLAATLVFSVLPLLPRLRPRMLGFLPLGALVLGLAAILLVPRTYWERQATLGSGDDASISRRLSYVDVGLSAFADRPLIGQGPGMFQEIYSRTQIAQAFGAGDLARAAHNTYMEVLVGSGLLGIIPFLLLILTALGNFIRSARRLVAAGDRETAMLVWAYTASFVSILAYFFMLSSETYKYFWLSLALSQVCANLAAGPTTIPAGDAHA